MRTVESKSISRFVETGLSAFDVKLGEALQKHKSIDDSVYLQALERQLAPQLPSNPRRILFHQSLQRLRQRFPGNVATVVNGTNKGKLWWYGEEKLKNNSGLTTKGFNRVA